MNLRSDLVGVRDLVSNMMEVQRHVDDAVTQAETAQKAAAKGVWEAEATKEAADKALKDMLSAQTHADYMLQVARKNVEVVENKFKMRNIQIPASGEEFLEHQEEDQGVEEEKDQEVEIEDFFLE